MESNTVYMVSQGNEPIGADFLHNLIGKAKNGDQAAFTELYNLYFKKIYRFIFFRVSHKEIAEDLAEDVFIKAYSKLNSVKEHSSFQGWLYQIARNSIIDYYREKKIEIDISELENVLEYEHNIVDSVNLQFQQQALLEVIRTLPKDQQLVIRLKFLEDLDNAEISEIIGKSEGAIRVIQHRALAKLEELLNNHSNPSLFK